MDKMRSAADVGKARPSELDPSSQPEHAVPLQEHPEGQGGIRTLPTAASVKVPEDVLPHLALNIELGTGVFAKQLHRGSDGLDVPLFPDGLDTIKIDSICYLQPGRANIVCKFSQSSSIDIRSLKVIVGALISKPFVYINLGSALETKKFSLIISDIGLAAGISAPPNSLYLPIIVSLRDATASSDAIQVGKPAQLCSPLLHLTLESKNGSSDHEGPLNTHHPSVATQNASLVGIAHSGEQLAADKIESVRSPWQLHQWLDLGDTVRQHIENGLQLKNDTMEKLKDAFDFILKGEISGNLLEFKHILFSRLDKVVEAVVSAQFDISSEPLLLTEVLSRARKIHTLWEDRFAPHFLKIDNHRAWQLLCTSGRLRFVLMHSSSKERGSPVCYATKRVPGAGTSTRQVELGYWFLNMACVFRDGLSNSQCGTSKYGPDEIATLPFLEGVETFEPDCSYVRYRLEGNREKMLVHLQDKVGKEIRILRGYQLNSRLAPAVGIRYDGWYYLISYSIKLLDDGTEKYVVELKYTRLANQPTVEEYAGTAIKPSMTEDWDLYQKILNHKFKMHASPLIYSLWRRTVEQEEMERRERHQNQEIARKPKAGSA